MRCRLTIIALLVLAGIAVVIVSSPASGDADPGIKKQHLDPTPGDFVDDVTIEIDDTHGLQVKDEGITADKIGKKVPYYVVPRWTYKIAAANNYDEPNDFSSLTAEGSMVSFGDIRIESSRLRIIKGGTIGPDGRFA